MASEQELENQLVEAGEKLVSSSPPASKDELLQLLNQVENCLMKVEQSPSESTQTALSPLLKALVADSLLKHSDVDIKVAVAACLSEITRISAPDAPYEDDQMREVFRLIVSSFENLSDNTSPSYAKRITMLDTVAKVRSCVVMLDLECDALILEMFQHLLKTVRDYHPENVFSSMETIMTLVLEESEEISPELFCPLLDSVKKGNEEVLPVAQKLANKVLENCASKIKIWLVQAVKSLGISVDDYCEVVSSICQERHDANDQNEAHTESDQPVSQEKGTELAPSEPVDPAAEMAPKPVVSNGTTQAGDKGTSRDTSFLKNQDQDSSDLSKTINASSRAESEGVANIEHESKLEEPTRTSGRKPTSVEIPEVSHIDKEKNIDKEHDNETQDKGVSNEYDNLNPQEKKIPDNETQGKEEPNGANSQEKELPKVADGDQAEDKDVPSKLDCDETMETAVPSEPNGDDTLENEVPRQRNGDKTLEKGVPNEPEGDKTLEKEVPSEPDGNKTLEKEVSSETDGDKALEKEVLSEPEGDKTLEKEVPNEPEGDKTLEKEVPSEPEDDKTLEKEVPSEPDGDMEEIHNETHGDKTLEKEDPSESHGYKTLEKEVPSELHGDKTLEMKVPIEDDGEKTLANETFSKSGVEKNPAKEVLVSPESIKKGKDDPSSLVNQEAEEEAPNSTIEITREKEVPNSPDNEQDAPSSSDSERTLDDEVAAKTVLPTENENENTVQSSSPKELGDQNADDEMMSPIKNLNVKSSTKAVRSKKKQIRTESAVPANDDCKNVSEVSSDMGRRPKRHTNKKTPSGASGESKIPASVDVSKERKKGDEESKEKESEIKGTIAKSSLKEDGKKKARGKAVKEVKKTVSSSSEDDDKESASEGEAKKSASEDDDKESASEDEKSSREKAVHKETKSSSNSSKKSSKVSRQLKKTPTASSKGKRKASAVKDYGDGLVGYKIKVLWPDDDEYYPGKIESFDPVKKEHKVNYDDGDSEVLKLKDETWEFVSDSESHEEKAAGLLSPDVSSERPHKKNAKSSRGLSAYPAKGSVSGKGGASSSKSKGTVAKSGSKSGDASNSNSGGKMKGKAISKSNEPSGGRSTDRKSTVTSKTSKSKNADSVTPKITKPKQDSFKTTSKPKQDPPSKSTGKRPRSGGKSDFDDDTKLKSLSSKTKKSRKT